MKKPYSKEQYDIIRDSRNFQRGNTVEQRKELAQALLAKEAKENANKVADILYEAFGKEFNVTKNNGIRKYHIAKKDIVVQLEGRPLVPVEGKTVLGEGQIIVTVGHNGKPSIRINSDKGDVLYEGKELSQEDLVAEIPFLKNVVADGGKSVPSPTSKFVQQSNTAGNMSEEELEALLVGYEEDPEGSKPR